jgi:hypothetical protein
MPNLRTIARSTRVSNGRFTNVCGTSLPLLGDAVFPVWSLGLRQVCDLFASGVASSPYHVQSKTFFGLLRLFLEAISGKEIQITN